jgi:hypothetical protein
MVQPDWADQEIEELARKNAGRARAMIGDWLCGDSDEQEVQWIPGRWIGRVDIGTLPEQLSRRGRIARRDTGLAIIS